MEPLGVGGPSWVGLEQACSNPSAFRLFWDCLEFEKDTKARGRFPRTLAAVWVASADEHCKKSTRQRISIPTLHYRASVVANQPVEEHRASPASHRLFQSTQPSAVVTWLLSTSCATFSSPCFRGSSFISSLIDCPQLRPTFRSVMLAACPPSQSYVYFLCHVRSTATASAVHKQTECRRTGTMLRPCTFVI